jgi:predicted ATPase
MLKEARKSGAAVQEMVLKPLSIVDIHQLLADCLQCEKERTQALAELINEKTGGNPFFAIQFLTALAEEGYIVFEADKGNWSWNLERIRSKGFTDNVVELMAEKLNRLPESTQEALRQLACLGNSATIATLNMVRGDSEQELQAVLWDAVRAGLISRLDGGYAFMHDRVQEAAYALIPKDLRPRLHLGFGRSLIAKMGQNEIEANAHQGNGIFLSHTTHMYCVFIVILHCRSHGSRNPGGLPRSMVSRFESGNREASDLPLDALLWKVHRVAEQLTRTVRGKAARLRLDG